MTPETAPIYIWQMNDGRWHVSPLGGRPSKDMTEAFMLLHREGIDHGFDSRADLVAALKNKGFRAWETGRWPPRRGRYSAGKDQLT